MLDRRSLVNPVLPDPLIDVRGAATTLGVSVRTVYSLMASLSSGQSGMDRPLAGMEGRHD